MASFKRLLRPENIRHFLSQFRMTTIKKKLLREAGEKIKKNNFQKCVLKGGKENDKEKKIK